MVTAGVHTVNTRVGTLHVHGDGTFKFFPSRDGRNGKFDVNIREAQIAGYIPLPTENAESRVVQPREPRYLFNDVMAH